MSSTMAQLAKPAHKSVARSIGYALTLGEVDGWAQFTAILLLRLDDAERVALAYAALQALHPDHTELTVTAALGGYGAGFPGAPLFNFMDEATFWADMAEPDELDAYALASFNRMAPGRQAAFLGFIQRRLAA